MDITSIERLVAEVPCHGQGVSCSFWRIDEKWGVKVYDSKQKRDNCVLLQSLAHDKGLAPEVGRCFNITVDNVPYFCYITEIAEVVLNRLSERFNHYPSNSWNYPPQMLRISEAACNRVERKLKAIGIEDYDMHDENIGILNGRLVCIDFSESLLKE